MLTSHSFFPSSFCCLYILHAYSVFYLYCFGHFVQFLYVVRACISSKSICLYACMNGPTILTYKHTDTHGPRTHSGKDKHTCNEQIKSTTTITFEESTESNAHTATHVCLCTFEYTVARAFTICFVCRCCRQRCCISVCVRVCMCGMCTFSCGISINYQRKFEEAREKKQQTPMHTLILTHAKNNLYDSPWNERDRARPRLIHNTHRTHLISQFREFTTRGSLTLPLCAFDFVFLSFFVFSLLLFFCFVY